MADIGCQTVFTSEDERMLEAAFHRSLESPNGYFDLAEVRAAFSAMAAAYWNTKGISTALAIADWIAKAKGPQAVLDFEKLLLGDKQNGTFERDLVADLKEIASQASTNDSHAVRAMARVQRELGLSAVQYVSTPLVVGTKGVEEAEDKAYEVAKMLHNCRIPHTWRDEYTVNAIIFVNRSLPEDPLNPQGTYTPAGIVNWRDDETPRAIFIFRTPTGRFREGEDLLRDVAHEIAHINYPRILKMQKLYAGEWGAARRKQSPPTKYARISVERGNEEEYIAECYAHWVACPEELEPEMRQFFDKCCGE